MRQIELLGIKVTAATMAEIHGSMDRMISSDHPGIVLSANAHAANLARKRPWLSDLFKRADVVHADGGSILLAARMCSHRIPERITWADWARPLARHVAAKGYRLFLLGGPDGLARDAAQGLQRAVPTLHIVGTHHGYFEKEGPENTSVIHRINRAQPDMLWVGMGMPLQEAWLLKNRHRLNAKVCMTCGSAFKYMAGRRTRCPKWMQDCSLEWLWMLLEEPRRGLVRYGFGNPLFLVCLIRSFLGSRFGPR
jgi:N-acetylglucosaminyldiphosphoundecaprenol N-acetyl-beta-D-mannosaminyltransferase